MALDRYMMYIMMENRGDAYGVVEDLSESQGEKQTMLASPRSGVGGRWEFPKRGISTLDLQHRLLTGKCRSNTIYYHISQFHEQ